jgi:hypothetical protein
MTLKKRDHPDSGRILNRGEPMSQIVITNPRLEQYGPGLLTDKIPQDKLDKKPRYSIGETSKLFFGVSVHWMRWLEDVDEFYFDERKVKEGKQKPDRPALVFDGERLITPKQSNGIRYYTLDFIEKMAYGLAQNNRLTGAQLNNTLTVIEAQCRIYRYL